MQCVILREMDLVINLHIYDLQSQLHDSLCLEVKIHVMLHLISEAIHCQHITPVFQKSLVEVQGHGLELLNFSGLR